jgi:hypothetical protein
VAFGNERGEREPDLAVLALDDLLDVLLDLPETAAEILPVAGRLLSSLQGDLRGKTRSSYWGVSKRLCPAGGPARTTRGWSRVPDR